MPNASIFPSQTNDAQRAALPAMPTTAPHHRAALSVALSAVLCAFGPASLARTIDGVGQSVTVDRNSASDWWLVTNGAHLRVRDGGIIKDSVARSDGIISLDGGARAMNSLALYGATAIIRDSSVVSPNPYSLGLYLGGGRPSAGATATIINSDITGGGSAVSVDGKSRVDISLSRLKGDDQGLRVAYGGHADVSDTRIDGRLAGIHVVAPAPDGTVSSLTATRVHVKAGDRVLWVRDGASVDISDSTIEASWPIAGGGLQLANGVVRATDVNVIANERDSRGVYVLFDTSLLTFQRGSIRAEGARGLGATVTYGGVLSMDGTRIQADNIGVLAERGGIARLKNAALTTASAGSEGTVYARNGGVISIAASTLQSAGRVMFSTAGQGYTNTFRVQDSRLTAADNAIMAVGAGHASFDLRDSEVTSAAGNLFAADGNGSSSFVASGSSLQGDIGVPPGFSADFALAEGSRWLGRGEGVNHLSIDPTSQWRMTGASDTRSLHNEGTVIFMPGAFSTLTVEGDLTGAGLFEMNTDLAANHADLLRVGGMANGDHRILVRNSGGEPAAAGLHQEIVRTEGGGASFTLANRRQVVDAGTYRYTLQRSDAVGGRASDWSLVHVGSVPPVVPLQPGQVVPPVVSLQPGQQLSTGANAAVNTDAGVAQGIWYAEMNALVKRLGELRLGNDQGGAWARAFGQKQLINNRGGRGYSQNVGGMEFGADKLKHASQGRWYLGGLMGYSHAQRKFEDEGRGGTDSYHIGGYATYIADSGWYLDAVAKVNRMKHDFKVQATDGANVEGGYRNRGAGASLEAGRQMGFGNGWFVEPQVEVSVFHASGASYRMSNDMRVVSGSGNSTLLRANALVGRRIELTNAKQVQPYVKFGWSHELDGKSVVTTNGIDTRTDLSGGRAELGAGVIAALGGRHRLYADYEYRKGSRFESPWGINAGYRYVW